MTYPTFCLINTDQDSIETGGSILCCTKGLFIGEDRTVTKKAIFKIASCYEKNIEIKSHLSQSCLWKLFPREKRSRQKKVRFH